jgi:modulator of FtsH protease
MIGSHIESASPAPVLAGAGSGIFQDSSQPARVLRNTYALLSLTLLFSAGVAAVSSSFKLPNPGLVVTLVGYFGLLFAVHKLQNSAWSLVAVFGLTGFMGYTLGPILSRYSGLPNGGEIIGMAFGATAVTFIGLSAYVLLTRRDFSFMGGFLFAGVVVALMGGIAAVVFHLATLALATSGLVALLSVGLILFETSRIVHGGETNYVMATVGLFVSVFNLFTSLLSLLGMRSND